MNTPTTPAPKTDELPLLTVDQISAMLQDRRLYVVAEKTGLSYPTLKDLADGVDKNYGVDTIRYVTDYLMGVE